MKLTKKKVFVIALAICLIATLSFSTLAWFNAQDEVKNQFFVADSDDTTADDIFSVDVWEPAGEDENGDVIKEQTGLTFRNVVPGAVYKKEPTIENTGYYDQWIRVIVTVTDRTAWTEVLGQDYDLSNIFVGHDETKWTRYTAPSAGSNDTLVYVYYYNEILQGDHGVDGAGESVVLFTDVQLPGELTQDDMVKLAGGFELTIKAEAIQSDAIEADNAKAAFESIGWTAGKTYEDAMTANP